MVAKLTLNDKIGVKSVLLDLEKIKAHKNKKADKYLQQIILNSITLPLCKMFFLGNYYTDKGVVEKLATFIEDNTIQISPWYKISE
jgi:Na+-transporting methylmalonyl-CoA/oxaloacetate decarboxylase beta subunit